MKQPMESYSLLGLNQYIRQQLKDAMPEFYWVVAEINELQVNSAGHCFMELIEKAPQGGQITAKARANIWAYHFKMLSPYFETMTRRRLAAGLKVMLQVSVEFHELFGMSLQVTDINPTFTVGDLAMQRQAVIRQLMDEGVFDMNRELELPDLPQRIAVISSETAAGYGDFIDQLHRNPSGYAFRHTLFQAIVQGNEAETSIIRALEQVFERGDEFDAVTLIRGGGSQSDLSCFNSYRVASCLAQFPLPVITGIGHDRDETIADLVACIPLKTPTAVAEFLVNRAMTLDGSLQELARQLVAATEYAISRPAARWQQLSQRLQTIMHSYVRIQDREIHVLQLRLTKAVQALLLQKKQEQKQLAVHLQIATGKFLQQQNAGIPALHTRLGKFANMVLSHNKGRIAWLEDKMRLLDPVNLLRRGYSITLANGKTVRSAQTLEKGQYIETILYDGKLESIVN
jgi:exodeoxyribonuclease VII large subunit